MSWIGASRATRSIVSGVKKSRNLGREARVSPRTCEYRLVRTRCAPVSKSRVSVSEVRAWSIISRAVRSWRVL
jgi:hypothetical protein